MMYRRSFLTGLTASAALAPGALWALNENGASTLINSLVTDINGVIASGKSENGMFLSLIHI